MKDGEVINGEFVSAERIWSTEDIDAQNAKVQAFKAFSDDDLLKEIVLHAKASVKHHYLGNAATVELGRRGKLTEAIEALAVKRGVI